MPYAKYYTTLFVMSVSRVAAVVFVYVKYSAASGIESTPEGRGY